METNEASGIVSDTSMHTFQSLLRINVVRVELVTGRRISMYTMLIVTELTDPKT